MKKIICMILSVALCGTFVLSGCGKQDKNGGDGTADKKENEKEIVVATNRTGSCRNDRTDLSGLFCLCAG